MLEYQKMWRAKSFCEVLCLLFVHRFFNLKITRQRKFRDYFRNFTSNKHNSMKSKATLKQIAKELGVSVSTVSKALNDSPEISEPTKQRVQEYAKLKNYKPNAIGLNLKNRSTKTIELSFFFIL